MSSGSFHGARVVLFALLGVCSAGCRSEVEQQVVFVNWTPNQPYKVRITGRDFRWHMCYPGPDDTLGTSDDIQDERHLHLPAHTRVQLELTSDDYVYSLAFPHWNEKEIAVPDLRFQLEFQTHDAGTFDLRGNQMCGYTHPELLGQLTVHSPGEFDAWLDQRRRWQQ